MRSKGFLVRRSISVWLAACAQGVSKKDGHLLVRRNGACLYLAGAPDAWRDIGHGFTVVCVCGKPPPGPNSAGWERYIPCRHSATFYRVFLEISSPENAKEVFLLTTGCREQPPGFCFLFASSSGLCVNVRVRRPTGWVPAGQARGTTA